MIVLFTLCLLTSCFTKAVLFSLSNLFNHMFSIFFTRVEAKMSRFIFVFVTTRQLIRKFNFVCFSQQKTCHHMWILCLMSVSNDQRHHINLPVIVWASSPNYTNHTQLLFFSLRSGIIETPLLMNMYNPMWSICALKFKLSRDAPN